MPLLSILRDEATRRGHLAAGARLDAAAAFRLVRDMPYRRASDRRPETILREWTGTCSGKHYLLADLLDEIGLPNMVLVATHEFDADNSPWLPPHLLEVVRERPVPDVHNFLRVQHDPVAGESMTVDCTWPAGAARLGMPANIEFVPGTDHQIACDPIELFHVPADADPQEFKERVIRDHVGPPGSPEAARRDAFIAGLSDWLAAQLG
jgi:hypothetical protein